MVVPENFGKALLLALGLFLLLGAATASAQAIYLNYSFTNFVGLPGTSGINDGTGSGAQFNPAAGVALDGSGNLYVADEFNCTIRRVTPGGVVTTIAGSPGQVGYADGTNGVAEFYYPTFVAVDRAGNLYVTDSGNYSIRKLTPVGTNWVVTTIAGYPGEDGNTDGMGSVARFANPVGIAVDSATNLYVADEQAFNIRKLTPVGPNWMVTTLAGPTNLFVIPYPDPGFTNGTGSAVAFNYPTGVAVDSAGNVYVADTYNYMIRKVTPAGVVTTVAGTNTQSGGADGPVSTARFSVPIGVAVDAAGNMFVTDNDGDTIRRISPDGQVRTLGGVFEQPAIADGTGSAAGFSGPLGIAVDGAGKLYVADAGNNRITKGTPPPGAADLAVTKTVDQTNAYVGATVTFSIMVTNPGPSAASPVVVAEQLVTPGLSYLGFNNLYANSAFDGTYWTITNLPAGTAAQLQVRARLMVTGTQTNTAVIQSSGTNDPNTNNNTASATVVAIPLPPIGGASYADSGDFTLNTTGFSEIIGGASYSDSGDFTLNTTGVSRIIGGASYADSSDFTLNTTGVSPIMGGASSADSGDFVLNTTGVLLIIGGASFADSLDFTLDTGGIRPFNLTGTFKLAGGAFQFSFSNAAGASFSIFGATNPAVPFGNWTFLGTVTGNPPGQFQFTDPQGSNYPQRFYRATSP